MIVEDLKPHSSPDGFFLRYKLNAFQAGTVEKVGILLGIEPFAANPLKLISLADACPLPQAGCHISKQGIQIRNIRRCWNPL